LVVLKNWIKWVHEKSSNCWWFIFLMVHGAGHYSIDARSSNEEAL